MEARAAGLDRVWQFRRVTLQSAPLLGACAGAKGRRVAAAHAGGPIGSAKLRYPRTLKL